MGVAYPFGVMPILFEEIRGTLHDISKVNLSNRISLIFCLKSNSQFMNLERL